MAPCRQGNPRLLDAVDLQDFPVEIADPEVFQPLRTAPILKTDALSSKHQEVLNAILGSLDLTDVMSVASWRRVTSSDVANLVPTILVKVGFKSNQDWRPVREIVVKILD